MIDHLGRFLCMGLGGLHERCYVVSIVSGVLVDKKFVIPHV